MRTDNDKETLTFQPYLSMNDYTGLAPALLAGVQESVLESFLTCRNIGRNSRSCNLSTIVMPMV